MYIGAGGGLLLGFQEFSIAERLFARLKFENSSLKISPFCSIDAGIITSIPAAFRSWTAIPEISTQLGLRFRLKNGDNLSCSIGMNAMIINSYIIPVIALPALSIGYTF